MKIEDMTVKSEFLWNRIVKQLFQRYCFFSHILLNYCFTYEGNVWLSLTFSGIMLKSGQRHFENFVVCLVSPAIIRKKAYGLHMISGGIEYIAKF